MDKTSEKQSLWVLMLYQAVTPKHSCVLRQHPALWFVSSCACVSGSLTCQGVDQRRVQEGWAAQDCISLHRSMGLYLEIQAYS